MYRSRCESRRRGDSVAGRFCRPIFNRGFGVLVCYARFNDIGRRREKNGLGRFA